MGKARRRSVRGSKASEPPEEEERMMEELEPSLCVSEEADDFQEQRLEEAVLAALGNEGEEEEGEREEEEEEEEEVLGLELPEDDDEEEENEDEDDDDVEDMESDLEEEDPQRRGSGLPPDELAWGHRKQLYYGSDYYGKAPRPKAPQKGKAEAEAEELEEEEAAQGIRRRLAETLAEEDYGLDLVEAYAAAREPAEKEPGNKVAKDLGSLSRKERLKLLRKESPELTELMRDFEAKMTELRDELEPLSELDREGVIIPEGGGREYLQTKYHLYLNYCCNVSFYLALKAKRVPVRGHPVIERLLEYRNLINDLGEADRKVSAEIRLLLTEPQNSRKKEPKRRKSVGKGKNVCKVSGGKADEEPAEDSELDEEAALSYYKEMEEKIKRKKKRGREEAEEDEGRPIVEEEPPGEKRSATYQIVKNKGLTPKRKKIDRNPRVKHREKFRRAKVRRKGQVREVRREEQRYGGELSGIRAGVKKSIKLK